jgi:SAM-dependent methyltransferase
MDAQGQGSGSPVGDYLMAGQASEVQRLQLQSLVWEPAGERLLAQLGDGADRRVLDVGCGCLGWLRLLSRWTAGGQVIGTDIDPRMVELAGQFAASEGLSNVDVRVDNLFDSELEPGSFDLVHARFQLAPLGRADEQIRSYLRLVRSGGRIVIEEPDAGSWHYNPHAPALAELVELILQAFRDGGGDFDAGRQAPDLFRVHGLTPSVRAEVLALPPGHPYLRLPLQFSTSLQPRLLDLISQPQLDDLRARAEDELDDPDRWATTFALIQTWATVESVQPDRSAWDAPA